MKYQWYYCKLNGMIGKYRKLPSPDWMGPYSTIRELKEGTAHLGLIEPNKGGLW